MRYAFAVVIIGFGYLLPITAAASLPDLCADVYLGPSGAPYVDSTGMRLSRFCTWTHEDHVTLWANSVCCSIGTTTASCTAPDPNGRCLSGAKFWCDYAVNKNGVVACQQPWPDACAAGMCSSLPIGATPLPDTEPLCCIAQDICTVVDVDVPPWCDGFYVMCDSPFTNLSGSVGCADVE